MYAYFIHFFFVIEHCIHLIAVNRWINPTIFFSVNTTMYINKKYESTYWHQTFEQPLSRADQKLRNELPKYLNRIVNYHIGISSFNKIAWVVLSFLIILRSMKRLICINSIIGNGPLFAYNCFFRRSKLNNGCKIFKTILGNLSTIRVRLFHALTL